MLVYCLLRLLFLLQAGDVGILGTQILSKDTGSCNKLNYEN